VKPALSTAEVAQSAFIVRDAADINRLILQLFTRWKLPRVEIRIDSIPAVSLQLMQHRITQIREAPSGGLSVVLAALTFVAGTFLGSASFYSVIWTPAQIWQKVLLLAIAALYAAVVGKGLGLAWTRVKLMRELRRLRSVTAGGIAGTPAHYAGRVPHTFAGVSAAIAGDVVRENAVRQSVLSRRPRSRVIVRHTGDLRRLFIHLFTHWKLPRVQIDVDGVAPVDVQRAQDRITHFSEACHCALGAWLAGATIMGGVFYVEWESSHNWDWMVPESWGPLGLVPVAALCAALTGMAIEMVWTRVKIMRAARGVRHRLET
jgi:hypothetical protein